MLVEPMTREAVLDACAKAVEPLYVEIAKLDERIAACRSMGYEDKMLGDKFALRASYIRDINMVSKPFAEMLAMLPPEPVIISDPALLSTAPSAQDRDDKGSEGQ